MLLAPKIEDALAAAVAAQDVAGRRPQDSAGESRSGDLCAFNQDA